ncbi:MAG: UDP-glucose--hexose-1-phosphate uridylyltransferase [Acidimicrobiia bacterium]
MTPADLPATPHRRYDPLGDRWVLVSAHRTARPWQGAEDRPSTEPVPSHDPDCYLCPGNTRASGETNPAYEGTFAFTNDYPALLPDVDADGVDDGLFRAEPQRGTCRVICFSPDHATHLAHMDPAGVRAVVDLWADETADLGERWRWVQVFENRGQMMGASNPHPHGQIWAGEALPEDPAAEDASQARHLAAHGTRLLADYAAAEAGGPREVLADEDWLVVVPFWAVWPFETLVLPRFEVRRLPDLAPERRDSLAVMVGRLIRTYDRVFDSPFPYSMGWHGAPFDGTAGEHWTLHAHFYPPLLRSASVRKFMVGYELLAEAQRDLTAEAAADRLRSLVD